jgi:GDP/UDP-N,N'-diacetylbacillosamine 2-epimerase (hydrolysing)
LHGGERSGTLDEPTRHAISKFATLHWVATEESKARLLRMGEDARRISVTGAPGLDGLREEAQSGGAAFNQWSLAHWGLPLDEARFALVLMHPEAADAADAAAQTRMLADAVTALAMPVIWLKPNADAGSAGILSELAQTTKVKVVTHLARPEFCAAMAHAAVMLGNSSSGIIEAASFGTPVVNIGSRQRLRQRNANVSDVDWQACSILDAGQRALAQGRFTPGNVYGEGDASDRMLAALNAWVANPDVAPPEKCNAD